MKTLAIILSVIMLSITLGAPSVLAGVDRCFSLDGDGDYVDLGQGTFDTLDDITIEMWVRLDEYNCWDAWIANIFYGGNIDTDEPSIKIGLGDNYYLHFDISQADGAGEMK